MVKATYTSTYVRHTGKQQNDQTVKKDPPDKSKPAENSSDLLYVLDLSGINSKNEQNTYQADKSAVWLDLTKEAKEKLENKKLSENERVEAEEAEGEEPRPSDDTRKLTRMLVAAKTQDEVQSVLMDTYNHMRDWQKLASTGDKEAIKVVRKLNRLISRGNRKISDLHKEMITHQRQQRAEKAENKREAQRLENELKEAQRERKARERRYLQERDDSDDDEESSEFGPTVAETEAKMRQLAAAMAALKTNTADASDVGSYDNIAAPEVSNIEGAEASGEEPSEDA